MEATCPKCSKKYRKVRPELIGKRAQCTCGHTFRLGQVEPDPVPTTNAKLEENETSMAESVDLSSASVFENSYSDLDQILSGQGSTAPLSGRVNNQAPKSPVFSPPTPSATGSSSSTAGSPRRSTPSEQASHQQAQSFAGYGSTGMSVGFVAAVLSSCAAGWFSLLVLSSRYSVLRIQPLEAASQTLHNMTRGTFGDLIVSAGLERSFVLLSWVIATVAAGLFCLAIAQLANAFVKLFRRRRLLGGIDGLTGLTAVLLLFLMLSTIFFHFSHMRELHRDLTQKAGGQVDEDTVLGRNLTELQAVHSAHSRQFMTCMIAASSVPLFVCLLSLTRVYVTLGEPEFRPRD